MSRRRSVWVPVFAGTVCAPLTVCLFVCLCVTQVPPTTPVLILRPAGPGRPTATVELATVSTRELVLVAATPSYFGAKEPPFVKRLRLDFTSYFAPAAADAGPRAAHAEPAAAMDVVDVPAVAVAAAAAAAAAEVPARVGVANIAAMDDAADGLVAAPLAAPAVAAPAPLAAPGVAAAAAPAPPIRLGAVSQLLSDDDLAIVDQIVHRDIEEFRTVWGQAPPGQAPVGAPVTALLIDPTKTIWDMTTAHNIRRGTSALQQQPARTHAEQQLLATIQCRHCQKPCVLRLGGEQPASGHTDAELRACVQAMQLAGGAGPPPRTLTLLSRYKVFFSFSAWCGDGFFSSSFCARFGAQALIVRARHVFPASTPSHASVGLVRPVLSRARPAARRSRSLPWWRASRPSRLGSNHSAGNWRRTLERCRVRPWRSTRSTTPLASPWGRRGTS